MRSATFLVAAISAAAPAGAVEEMVSTRALSMGEAMRAYATGAAGVYLNPAGIALLRQYVMEADYQIVPQRSGHQVTASVVDSVTSTLAAGVYYNFELDEPALLDGACEVREADRTWHEGGLALAYPLGRIATVGASGRYLDMDIDYRGDGGDEVAMFTFDAGAVLRPFGGLHLGAAGRNLRADPNQLHRKLGLGAAWAFGTAGLIDFDAVLDFDGRKRHPATAGDGDAAEARCEEELWTEYAAGGEVLLGQTVALRGGWTWAVQEEAMYASGGLSYLSLSGALEAGARRQVRGGDEWMLSFGLRLFVQQ